MASAAACTKADARASVRIRLAAPADADGILGVYAPYIDTPITFEEEVPARDEFRARIAGFLAGYPCLVAESGGRIVGYAYAHAQHERAAYRWGAELSVYLAPAARGRGLGGVLYRALEGLLRAQGIKTLYGLVTVPNAASERLHGALGFSVMGIQRRAGYTCGAWHDVAWYVKEIGPFEACPTPPVPFPALAAREPEAVRAILDQANAEAAGQAS